MSRSRELCYDEVVFNTAGKLGQFMANKSNSYRSTCAKKDIQKYSELRQLLPDLCSSYLSDKGINCKTDTLVMICRDLLDFFYWLIESNPELSGKTPRELQKEHLAMLTYDDINEFQNYRLHVLNNKPTRVARIMSTLRTFFKYQYSRDLLPNDPTTGAASVRIPRNKAVVRLESEEVHDLVTAVEHSYASSKRAQQLRKKNKYRDTAIIVLLLNTGIRISELVGLNIEDVNLVANEPSIFVIRKGGGADQVFLNQSAASALSRYIELERSQYISPEDKENALFLSNRHSRFTVRSIQKMIEEYVKIALPRKNDSIHPHTFRKTYGTRLYDLTGDIKMVQDVLGHKDPSTTSTYYIGSSHKREARNIDPYSE